MTAYKAQARREGQWWVVEVPELETAGQAGSFSGVEQAAREIIASWLDIDEAAVEVEIEVAIPKGVRVRWDAATALEASSRKLQDDAAASRRAAVQQLREQGYTLAAISAALGVSTQRVAQLEHA